MIEIEKPQIECIETPGDASYGKYVIEPLERGYGTTLGNALRRIMLSSLPGTAATSIKIAGVQHEFSTIPGVKEDVTEIVLNVKSLLTKLHCEGTKTVYIEATGPCEVTAGDIKSDGEVEVLNPELHLATLDVGATLSMEITLSHGRGYVSADRNKAQRPGVIGVIPIDSIYTPVYKVNYTVENTRVGSMSDFDKLTLEVWTDSTISARDAVSLGAKILCDHFALFTDLSDTLDGRPIVVEKSADPQSTVLDMTIEELDLSVRSFNCLKRANINTVADLISKTEDEMMKVVTYLLENGQIKTTITRAKEVAPLAEKMITLAKHNDLASYRQALGFITKEDVAKKLFQELGPKYAERNGGYTRIVRTGRPPRRCWAKDMEQAATRRSSSWCNSAPKLSRSRPWRAGIFSPRRGNRFPDSRRSQEKGVGTP